MIQRKHHILLIAILITLGIITRLIYLNTSEKDFLNKQFTNRAFKKYTIYSQRGNIQDRNGVDLAVSSPTLSIWSNNKIIYHNINNVDYMEKIKKINNLLDVNILQLTSKKQDVTYFYLKRGVNPSVQMELNKLDIDGINFTYEDKRFYTYSNVTSHVVGFTNIDDIGIDGIEYSKNKDLTGVDGTDFFEMSPKGVVGEYKEKINVQNGKNIFLSLDVNIQSKVYQAVKNSMLSTKAKGISAIVLNATTGEILALVNAPNYNPNIKSTINANNIKNSAIVNVYDPGSIMKPLVIAKAIDDNKVKPTTILDTSYLKVGNKIIKDDHFSKSLNVEQIISQSSDIGTSKIALMYKPYDLWNYYRTLGFGTKLNTGFPGETNGILNNYSKWTTVDQALMSYGYGISVSLLQMAHSYLIFTNKGCLPNVTFERKKKAVCQQVISIKTADTVKKILNETTENGTGKSAKVDGIQVAGKTGTAQKLINGKYYNNKHISSFVGFAPVDQPKYIIAVMVDEPQNGYYAAMTAAPLFSNIVKSIFSNK